MRRRFNLNITAAGGFNPGSPLFFDDFNYTVTNSSTNAAANNAAFQTAGWAGAKAINVGNVTGALGNIYTTDVSAIPGHLGTAPGSTQRALCLNSLAGTYGQQTDFYLQYGSTTPGTIPANVWFQFWMYVCRSGAQMTHFHGREKFLYPTRNTYPATVGNNGGHWIFELAQDSSNPNNVSNSTLGACYALSRDGTIGSSAPSYVGGSAIPNGTTSHLGQTDTTRQLWVPNQWELTKIHYDTSGPQGVFEVWTRSVGASWVKRVEWIGGVTPQFTWSIDPAFRDGHVAFRMPTTMPGNNVPGTYDAWLYMQDFAIASSEAALPTYG